MNAIITCMSQRHERYNNMYVTTSWTL